MAFISYVWRNMSIKRPGGTAIQCRQVFHIFENIRQLSSQAPKKVLEEIIETNFVYSSTTALRICLSSSHTQTICSLSTAFIIGSCPLPKFILTPSEFITTTFPSFTQAYTFFPLTDSIVQLLPLSNSFSCFPGSQA